MEENTKFVPGNGSGRTQLAKFIANRHATLTRLVAQYYSLLKDVVVRGKRRYSLVKDADDMETGVYDKPLPCFGCGIGWFSFLLGFVFPPLWYYATFLYFGNYYRKDPRERAGLAASAITAMGFSLMLLVIIAIRWF